MSLVAYTITAIQRDVADAEASGKQVIAGATCSMYSQPSDTVVTLYDDASYTNGSTAKTTGANGQVVVWVEQGRYRLSVNGVDSYVTVGSDVPIDAATFAELEASSPVQTGQRAICRERANAEYILQAGGYTALAGDITCANGRVYALQVYGPVNAKQFGLTTGNQNEKLQEIANWLDESKTVFFTEDFAITETITFPNGGTVDFGNITIDGTGLPNSTVDRSLNLALKFTGSIDDAVSITLDIADGDDSFTAPSAGLSEGDTVIVRSNQTFVDGWAGNSTNRRGEIVTIESVSGDVYTVHEPFRFSYTAANSLVVEKMNPTKCKVLGGTLQMGGVASEHRGLQLIYARDSEIKGFKVLGAEDTSVAVEYSHTIRYQGECRDATTPTTGLNTGYGIAVINGSRNVDVDVVGYNCKHVVAGGGTLPSTEVRVKGTAYDSGITSTAFDCHEPCFDWTWDVECYGGMAGIGIRGSEQKVKIKVRDIGSSAVIIKAFDDPGLQYSIDVDVDTYGTGSSAVVIDTDSCPIDDVKVTGRVRNTLVNGLSLLGDSTNGVSNVQLGLDVDDSASMAYDIRYVTGISGSIKCTNSGAQGFQIFDSSDVDLSVNVESSTSDAVYLLRVSDAAISGLSAYSANRAAIFTDDCTNIDVSIRNIEAVGATSDCWRAVDTVAGKLTGSTLTAGRHGVFSSGTSDEFIITSNNGTGITSGTKYNLSGANNATANNLS